MYKVHVKLRTGFSNKSFLPCRCFLKLGEWQLSLQGINESTIPKVLQYYSHSTEHDRNWYKVSLLLSTLTLHFWLLSVGR